MNVSNTKQSKSNRIHKKRQLIFGFLFGLFGFFGWEEVTRYPTHLSFRFVGFGLFGFGFF
ncbi:hypothetical protein HanRHA438_Chr10g0479121 [Helianthus annuus]|nr:hypothetical protein HanRHA438_Chr10g0479121 [Helianthus annuus]